MEDDTIYMSTARVDYKYSISLKATEKRRFLWPKHHWLGLNGHWTAPAECDRLTERQKIITAALIRFDIPSSANIEVLEFSMAAR